MLASSQAPAASRRRSESGGHISAVGITKRVLWLVVDYAIGSRVSTTFSCQLTNYEAHVKHLIFGLAVATAATACGAVFNGGPAHINVVSSPANAEIWVDGMRSGATPTVLELNKKKEHLITFKRAGYQDVNVQVGRSFRGRYVVFDVLGGLLPVVIDAASQSWYVLDRNAVNVTLPSAAGQDASSLHGTLSGEQMKRILAGESPASVVREQLRGGR